MSSIIKHNSKELTLLKPVTNADYSGVTILTKSHWEYVELWLTRRKDEKAKRALFYWQQAKHFFHASENLPHHSRPLTSYYCCLNATKTLLCLNNIDVENISHGISPDRSQNESNSNALDNAFVKFQGSGALFELRKHLSEISRNTPTISIKDLLYNIPCVHRAYSITYSGSTELFVPINNLKFLRNEKNNKAWIEFDVASPKYSHPNALRLIPSRYERVQIQEQPQIIRFRTKNKTFTWNVQTSKKSSEERLENLKKYHSYVRKDLHYIYGESRLWYIKKENEANSHILPYNSLSLIFAVMHWMSELVRYSPEKFNKYMHSKQNWLLHEFIENALIQFVDEISCEITKEEIMSTGYRK